MSDTTDPATQPAGLPASGVPGSGLPAGASLEGDPAEPAAEPAGPPARRRPFALACEGVAVVLSPLIGFLLLRLRAMAPVGLPDPSMHTTYIVDPRDVFTRYSAAFAATSRMREGTQAGFLVLARLAYLAFGAVPGFFATRYVFALIVIVPAYLILRRLYGVPAGVLVIIAVMSSPVIITAWGTDYPDSATVSYIAGAIACLAMPCKDRWRPAWLAVAGLLFTLAVWSHGMGVVLAVTALAVYGAVRLLRERKHLVRDIALLGSVAVLVTFLLMIASSLVLGQFDFIRPTIKAAEYLNQPSQYVQWHSVNRHWALYVAYLLVPPSVIAAFALTFARRLRSIGTPQLFVGLVCAAQFAVFGYLQFFNHVQTLEMHYFSSTLWGVIAIVLAVVLAELAKPLSERPFARWLPPVLLCLVPLAYETDPHVPAFGWWPEGAIVAAIPVVFVAFMRVVSRERATPSDTPTDTPTNTRQRSTPGLGLGRTLTTAATVVAVTGSLLVLTVAPIPAHAPLSGVVDVDPPAAYASALGESVGNLIDWYQVSAELPSFVGNATYKGEQLMMWYPIDEGFEMIEPIGMYHAGFDSFGYGFANGYPYLTPEDAGILAGRRPAEVLLLSLTGSDFSVAVKSLARYRPVRLRTTVLRDGTVALHAWLILMGSFARSA